MNRADAVRVLFEAATRLGRRERFDVGELTFGPQCEFVTDTSPYVAASCSRQCGKSYGIGIKLVARALREPNIRVLYVTNTRRQARTIMWPVLHELHRSQGLGGKFHEVRLTYTLPNGSVIELGGANDEVEIERYRGPQYALVVIDEAQSIRPFIKELIFEILEPGQAKFDDPQILLTGTPNAARSGFLYNVVTGKERGWSLHHWTMQDNPYIKNAAEKIARNAERRGLTLESAAIQREYFGQWVRDEESLVYTVRRENLVDDLPAGAADWRYVLGIDFGFTNVTAYCVVAYSVELGHVCVVRSFQDAAKTPTGTTVELNAAEGEVRMKLAHTPATIAPVIRGLMKQYDLDDIVGDPGGYGKKYITQLQRVYGIPIKVAEKDEKLTAINHMNGDLATGKMTLIEHANEDLLFDASQLQIDWSKVDREDGHGNLAVADLVIDDSRTPDHLTDAWTYAYRCCWHFVYAEKEEAHPPFGSPEYEAWEEERRTEEELESSEEGDLPEADPYGLEGFGGWS